MSQTPVYIDVILVVNLVMDFLVLWATGKLAGVRIVYRRLLAASVLGAVYSVGSVFSDLSPWYDFPVKVIISGLIVILAF
jgi:stage II sporulation protein GA (sporulation sigma-E factor processing peptidase)